MLRKLFITVFACCAFPLLAVEPVQPDLSRLQSLLGEEKPDSVKPTAIPGLYEVMLKSKIIYLSQDGRFVIQGDLIDLKERTNVTEARLDTQRSKALAAIGEDQMVVFAPAGPAKHTITVFTDIDCAYCRKFHQEMADYNRNGIKVRYLMYPRAGIGSDSYNKAVAVWCSPDRRDAITRAKRGEAIEQKSCPNPVKEQYELGQALGVRGTPTIILEDGQLIPGYVPAARLAAMLDRGATN
jgi:thiol:disulfide interchange protein DsbC